MTTTKTLLGAVAIGRNEGERLRACLASLMGQVAHVVYVDSGSTDGSVAMAQSMGVQVVALDMTKPFTAARARNAGWSALKDALPGLDFVQFVDGDCEMIPGWLATAQEFLAGNSEYAVVTGRLRERHRNRSIYNRLCDIEWDTPIGDVKACGGIAMIRAAAFEQVAGFRSSLIAGEEPELCVRLRQKRWRIYRLNHEMALHDAAITRFSQWWRRTQRGGHAFAEGAWLHGAPPERHWVTETRRALLWGLALPLLAIALAVLAHPAWLCLLLAYPLQVLRLSRQPGGLARAFFLVVGKIAEAQGILGFYLSKINKSQNKLIEYK